MGPTALCTGDARRPPADAAVRVRSVHAGPHQVGGLDHLVNRSGDLVRRVNERWADAGGGVGVIDAQRLLSNLQRALQ